MPALARSHPMHLRHTRTSSWHRRETTRSRSLPQQEHSKAADLRAEPSGTLLIMAAGRSGDTTARSRWARGDLNFGERTFDLTVQYRPVPPDLGVRSYVVVDGAGENLWMLDRPVEIR